MPSHCEHIAPGSEIRRSGPGIAPVWHYHSEIELNLVIAGRGAYFLDNASYELSPGALVWMLPNQSHRLMPGPDLQMWVLTCVSDRLERAFLDDVAGHASRVLARDDALALDRLFTHVSQDADEPHVYRAGVEYALRSALHISMAGPEAAQPPLHPAVLNALQVLRHAPDVADIADLAKRCRVSPVYLRELLAKQTGRGFVEWRNRYRLERFQQLYPESNDLITAALGAGFGSYTQFHRVFLDIVGSTPGEWVTGGRTPSDSQPIVDFASAPDRSSNRMIWYALADVVLDDARRWIAPSFAQQLMDPDVAVGEYNAVASHVVASYDQHRFEAELVAAVERNDVDAAERLRTVCTRFDVFAENAELLSMWGLGLTDIAPIIATHILTAVIAVQRKAPPSRQRLASFVNRVAAALIASGSFEDAVTEDRQRATAAICLQSLLFRSAVLAAFNLGKPELLDAVAAAARVSMLATYGVDPSEIAA